MANNTVKLAVEEATKKTTAGDGRIVRIIGPVVDVKFDGAVPPIYNALTVEAETPIGHLSTILEVESQLPGGVVRTVAMSSTDGLQRGLIATDTGEPISTSSPPRPRSSRPASRPSTCSSPTSAAARQVCSAAPASARPF